MFVKRNIAQKTPAELLHSFKGCNSEYDWALVERKSPRNDITHARHVPIIFKKSVWRTSPWDRPKIEPIGIKVPKVLYCFGTVSDWFMVIEMTRSREPLSIVWRIGKVSPKRECTAATRMDMGFLEWMKPIFVDWVEALDEALQEEITGISGDEATARFNWPKHEGCTFSEGKQRSRNTHLKNIVLYELSLQISNCENLEGDHSVT